MNKTHLTNSIWKKIGWALLFIGLYFGVWRNIRAVVLDIVMNQTIEKLLVENKNEISLKPMNSLSFKVIFAENHTYKEYMFKIAGGIFFLFGILGLLFLSKSPFNLLLPFIALQIVLILLFVLFFWLGIFYWSVGIQIVDWLARYLEPLIDLGFVALNANFSKLKR